MRNGLCHWLAGVAAAVALGWIAPPGQAQAPCCSGNNRAVVKCPVDKREIKSKKTAPVVRVNNQRIHVCSAPCAEKLRTQPETYLRHSFQDPVTGKWFKLSAASPREEREGVLYLFMSADTKVSFDRDPARSGRQ